MSVLKSKK